MVQLQLYSSKTSKLCRFFISDSVKASSRTVSPFNFFGFFFLSSSKEQVDCHSKIPQTSWFQSQKFIFLIALEARISISMVPAWWVSCEISFWSCRWLSSHLTSLCFWRQGQRRIRTHALGFLFFPLGTRDGTQSLEYAGHVFYP